MALDRLLPVSTTPGAVTGDSYMDAVQEEVTGLWDRSTITLTTTSGATDTITATATPALTGGLGGSMNFILKPAQTNTGAVTLNVNASGAVAVVDATGTALVAGALRINGNYFLHYDSGISKYVVVNYVPAATATQGLVLIKTQLAAASATIDFVNGVSSVVMDDTYDAYEVEISTAIPATDDVEFHMLVGTGGGPTYQATLYAWQFVGYTSAGTAEITGVNSDAQIKLSYTTAANKVGNAAGENYSASVRFNNPEAGSHMHIYARGEYSRANDSFPNLFSAGGVWLSTTAITAVRFKFSSGNITSGRFTLYGKTKA